MYFASREFANAADIVADVVAEALRPAPPVDLVDWTERNIHFGPNDPFPGPYSFERFPFFRRVLDVLGPEDPARKVVLRKSAQIGGTILGDAFLLGWLDLVPTQLMCVHPTLPQARAWVNNKIKPAVRNSEGLQAILSFDNPKDVKATELLFERLDARGGVIVTGANSAASLSQHSVKAQLQDDLAKWDQNDAGDPESQADSRSQAFEDAKIFKVSTPMVEGSCRIDQGFKGGTQEYYHVPCPHCQHLHPLEWANMQANIDVHGAAGAFFTCPDCGTVIEEKHRQWMVDPANGARWVAHHPAGQYPSFHFWSAYAPLMSWARIAEAWLAAKGDPAKEQTFTNDVAGLPFRMAGEAPEWRLLQERADASDMVRGRVSAGYYFLLAGADCQDDRVEVGIWAFGPDLRRMAVDHLVIQGKITDEDTKLALDKLRTERSWPDAFGNARRLEHIFIDAGYEREAVLDWVARHPASWATPIVGAAGDNAPVLGLPQTRARTIQGKASRDRRLVFPVGGGAIKSYLYADLRKGDARQRGFVGLPQGFPEDWFEQLTAERRQRARNRRGFWEYRWTLPGGKRNEVLDCAVYAYAAADRLGWKRLTDAQWQAIAAERDRPPDGHPDLFTVDQSEMVRPVEDNPPAATVSDNRESPFSADADEYWKD